MDKRIIDISGESAYLSVRNEQLIIKRGDLQDSVPLEEIAALIVAHPAVQYTHAVLNGLCECGGSFIVCDEKKMPAGILMPLSGHSIQTERFAAQIGASAPLKKRLWEQVIKAKILAQAKLLKEIHGDGFGLPYMASKVRSGDPANIEGQASRRYWPALFGINFTRKPVSSDNVNVLLNYGYAIVRSMTARSLCASGLHPSIGIHHHNRYNAFCLADDLMEPFRPTVDKAVVNVLNFFGHDWPLNKESKGLLLTTILEARFNVDGEMRTLFDALQKSTSSLAEVFTGKRRKLTLFKP
ncbi:MAG: type II CRISPR-associated endonuclease Cas1 [candidate division Zixibacteria bacterium CG_4_9_14_3_um_filter_46_8]|nr:MAG: type II CRISPR-associated endonuclease Cas1 [candidate division Zixibacteria bacterium CG_4_9_14_3_um_filter_46_8]